MERGSNESRVLTIPEFRRNSINSIPANDGIMMAAAAELVQDAAD